MEKDQDAIKKVEPVATPQADTSTVTPEEARIAQLEADKAKVIEEKENYKIAFLKEKSKSKEFNDEDESDEDRIKRIVAEQLAETKIAQIDQEKEELVKKLLKENKELKLANLNKTDIPPASMGTHSESLGVTDTRVTPEQLAALKTRGWSDKDIERYKKNLNRYSGR